MGSRKIRLQNETLRREQATAEAKERDAARRDLQAGTKALLEECSVNRQAISKELLKEFKKNNQERLNMEKARKEKADEEKKVRGKAVSENSQAVRNLLAEFHKIHLEMSNIMEQTLKESKEKRLAAERSRCDYARKYASELDAYFKSVQRDTDELLRKFKIMRQEMKKQQLDFLKAEEARRIDQARQDKEARLEFLLETYDLDLGVKKKIIPALEEQKVEAEALPVVKEEEKEEEEKEKEKEAFFLPEAEALKVPVIPVTEEPVEELITVLPVAETGEEAAVVTEVVEVPEAAEEVLPPAESEGLSKEAVAKEEEYVTKPEVTKVTKAKEEQKKRSKKK